jgi:predicted transcriptional regulator
MHDLSISLNTEDILMSRPTGEKAKAIIKTKILSLAENEVLMYDFSDILAADVSFFDEAVLDIQLDITNGNFSSRRIIIGKMIPDIRVNLSAAIRERYAQKKDFIPVLEFSAKGIVEVVGDLEDNLNEAFKLIQEHQQMTARKLIEIKPNLAINSASNKLKKLFDYGLIKRFENSTSEGREYIYEAVN